VIMLPEIEGHESAAAVAQKIRAGLAVPFVIGGSAIAMTASIGTAIYPVDGQNLRSLIKQADIAMYRAKSSAALRQARLSKQCSTSPHPTGSTDRENCGVAPD
jgi:GGDEF domain-containing protein